MRTKIMLTVFAGALMALQAQAQLIGVPVGRGAEPGLTNDVIVSGGLVLGDEINLYGGRLAYNVLDDVFVFGDLGAVDPDEGDMGYGLQVGGQLTLPPIQNLAVDVAVRGTLGYASVDQKESGIKAESDIMTLSLMGVTSYRIDDMFTVYGVLGFAYSDIEVEARVEGEKFSASDDEFDPAIGVGVSVDLMPQFSVYGEVIHIDEPWIGIGAAMKL
jgi:opacity protein-like surface antigen